ncbi:MAG: hypothetical protein EOP11_25970, partial [Proteobacteria bacterium]
LNPARHNGRRLAFALMAGASLVVIAGITAISHLDDSNTPLDPFSLSFIPVFAALSFLVAGIAVSHRAYRYLSESAEEKYRTWPAALSVLVLAISLSLWQLELAREVFYFNEQVGQEADHMRREVGTALDQTSRALKRYAARIEYLGTHDTNFLELDSHSYIKQLPIIKRIGLIKANYRTGWTYPLAMDSQVEGFDQSSDPLRKAALDTARETREPTLSHVVWLRSGNQGFILPVALFPKGKFAGFTYATVDTENLFRSLNLNEGYRLVARENGQELFTVGAGARFEERFRQARSLSAGESRWEISVIPSQELFNKSRSRVPYLILTFGAAIATLLNFFLHHFFRSRRDAFLKAKEIIALNTRL